VVLSVLLCVFHLLLVNILLVLSANGCMLIKPNHLNLDVLCDCVIFYYAIFCFIGIPKISFVTIRLRTQELFYNLSTLCGLITH
jgi:hypothetical protein